MTPHELESALVMIRSHTIFLLTTSLSISFSPELGQRKQKM